MKKQLLLPISFSIILIAGIFLLPFLLPSSERKNNFSSEEENELHAKQDNADIVQQYEFDITKDPATNTVPRERLIAAYQYAEELRAQQKTQRSSAAITGGTWVERGPNNCGGRTRSIMVDPNDATKKTVFAAGVGGGLWKTTDITVANPTWVAINDFFANIAITTLAYDPNATTTMYFGSGEGYSNADAIRGNGIWKSTDGGTTWNQLASTTGANFQWIQKIVVHPTGSMIFAATRSGLFKSSNGGTTFTKVLGAGTGATSDRIAEVELAADGSVWAAAGIFQTDGVYKAPFSGATTGDAATFVKQNTGANGFPIAGYERLEIATAPSNASIVYVVSQSAATRDVNAIYKTINGGTTWTTCTLPVDADPGVVPGYTRTQAWYDLICAVDPNNSNNVFVGGVDLFKSTNGGTSWNEIAHWYGGFGFQYVHADQHFIYFEPGSSSVLYFGNDGGIWRSTNATAVTPTITGKSSNYNVTQFYGCAAHPTAYSNYFLAGAQDNGSHQFNNSGINATIQVTGGDGCLCHIDQNEPQYQWTSYVYNNYYRSTNGGTSWTSVSFGGGSFVNPTDYDDASNVLYAAVSAGNFMRWTNPQTGATVANVGITGFSGGGVRHVSVSQNTPNRVFFGLDNGAVVRVDNANTIASGSAGNIVTTALAAGSVSCVAIQNGNDNHILITYSNYGVNSVWESNNALNAIPTFASVEGNLPDMPVRWALFSPLNNAQAMVATEVGVWTTDLLSGAATNWGPTNTGLANVCTHQLQLRASDNLVVAATHGRGLFTSDIFMTPYPDFVGTPTINYLNKNVQFTDGSYKSTSWAWDFGDGFTSTLKNPTHAYSTPGLYTVTLVINGNSTYTKTKISYVQILPNRATPYLVAGGAAGSFDINPIEYGSESIFGSIFQRGTSGIAGKNGTFSGPTAWVTDLASANYANNANANLYCPNYNLSAGGVYVLSFYGKWVCEPNYDGFRVEYSLNRGTSWTPLGVAGPNWYNFANAGGATAFPVNEPFFSSTSASYIKYFTDISFLAGNANVAFRFVFKADGSVTAAGVALDNFEISGPPNVPLPVEMLYFTGEAKPNYNLLSWATATEINNRGFDVERSVDAKEFFKIGFVNGAGNSTKVKEYSFKDEDVTAKTFYYRLKQLDFDGKEKYSNTIAITNRNKEPLAVTAVYPNPFDKDFIIGFNKNISSDILIELYSMSGKKLYSREEKDFKENFISIQTEMLNLTSGLYFLRMIADEKEITIKVIKD